MKTTSYMYAALAALLILTSCESENWFGKKSDIKLEVTAEVSTKSMNNSDPSATTEEISSDGLSLYLTTSVSDNSDNEFLSHPMTKGSIVTSENFKDQRSGDFNVRITDAGTTSIFCESKASRNNDKDCWYVSKGGENAQWPDDDKAKLDFWAWSGAESCSGLTIKDSKTFTFAYSGTKTTAEAQSDLVFANTANQSKTSDGSIAIHFYHALAAVQFVVGNLDDGITVNGISINNVKSRGNGSFVPAGTSVDTKFVWESVESPTTYSQTFSQKKYNRKSDANYQHCFDGSEQKSTFFVVPQSLAESENITLTINVTDSENRTYNISHSITGSAVISEWKAGKIYRYMISNGDGDVDITAEENSFDGTTKQGVKAENTGTLPTYVRALVIANWYNDGGKLVTPYTGTINYNTSKWEYQNGYYYYKDVLQGGQTTENLINEFTLSDEAPTNTGFELSLQMKILFQAVEWKKNTSWGPSNFTK